MKNIILCEGFDDSYILGYYLYKTNGWKREDNSNFSELYKFPKIKARNQGIEYYTKDCSKLAIWSVGGKNSYDEAFKFIYKVNSNNPEDGIQNVFILSDRDDCSIEDALSNIKDTLCKNQIKINSLINNEISIYDFIIDEKAYKLNVIPIIIPFDVEGAIETILISAIENENKENKFIVDMANKYVDEIKGNSIVKTFLLKPRLVLKSKFSSIISITNPDRSTALFNTLLMSHDWEKAESIKRHFIALDKYL